MSLSRIVPPSLVLLGTLTACGGGESPLETFESRVGYAIGLDIGTNLEGAGVEIDLDALARGLRDGMSGAEPLLSPAEGMEVLQEFQLRAEQEMTRRAEEGLRANREEGEAYLAENGAREGVITTESGLQ